MPLEIIEKDITTVDAGIVAHGVNCQGYMNSGVAKAIRNTWPYVYDWYKTMPVGKQMLGIADFISPDLAKESLLVANCYTQEFCGSDGAKYAAVEAIEQSLYEVFKLASKINLPIYLPQIGCGLGGLSWEDEVLPVIERYVTMFPSVDTYVCILPTQNKGKTT